MALPAGLQGAAAGGAGGAPLAGAFELGWGAFGAGGAAEDVAGLLRSPALGLGAAADALEERGARGGGGGAGGDASLRDTIVAVDM
jgi:hypothetical protein